MTRIHLICGPVGAGKSTYARALADRHDALVFSIDDWMARLFVADIPAQTSITAMDPAWFTERVNRCEEMIWHLAEQVLARGGSVVLDMGFIRRARRDAARARAQALGLEAQLHYVTADQALRRQRVEQRNAERGTTFAFDVTPAMFAFVEHMFEAPAEDEVVHALAA